MSKGTARFLVNWVQGICLFLASLALVNGNGAIQAADVGMDGAYGFSREGSASPLSQDGFDLLNLMTARADMKLVSSFEELNKYNSGLIMILGNWRPPFAWGDLENWVRRGGVVLVALDEAPPRLVQNRFDRLTGYQWSNLRLKYMGEKGIDLLPQRSFTEIQKLVPFDWSLPEVGDGNLSPLKSGGMGHTNSPSFLLSLEGGGSMGGVFARLPVAVELDLAPGMSMRLPAFRADFGVVANVGRGKIIQLADPDIFSNQMLELQGNFQFAWTILQGAKKDQGILPGDFPVMIVGQHVETEVFALPAPPLPLPELDLFQIASLASRALDEKLPDLEKPGGLFERISNRVASQMNRTFWLGFGAIALSVFGFLFFTSQRGAYRAREMANRTSMQTSGEGGEMAGANSPVVRSDARVDVLSHWMESHSTREIPLWELGRMSQEGGAKTTKSETANTKNRNRIREAVRLMNCIARGVAQKPERINKAIEVVAQGINSKANPGPGGFFPSK